MIQRDVLMRQVQMLTQALARVVFKRSIGEHDQALYRRVQEEENAAVPLNLGDRIRHVEAQLEGD